MRGLDMRIWQVSQKKCLSHHNLFVSPNPVFLVCLYESRVTSTSCLSKTDPLLEDLLFLDNWSWGNGVWSSSVWAKGCQNPHQWPVPSFIYSPTLILRADKAHSLPAPLISSDRNFFIGFNLILLGFCCRTRNKASSVFCMSVLLVLV